MITINSDQYLWTEKYRPKTVRDTILPLKMKNVFQQFVNQKNIPNLILSGNSGTGKTTIARALLEEIGSDYTIINSSLHANMDALRTEIGSFASSVSLLGGRKYIILDEADGLNPNNVQQALRNFMESFSSNCGFILTANHKNKLIPALHSRCAVFDFTFSKEEKSELAKQFHNRVIEILKLENIEYNDKVIIQFILKYFPDLRRILNELQAYSINGIIDSGILIPYSEIAIKTLISYLKDKNFTETRKWVKENSDLTFSDLSKLLYDSSDKHLVLSSIPELIEILATYQYYSVFVADQEINTMAALDKIMATCIFKD